ncbi:23S rRNA pseudouridine2605 synthase [Paenimyroides aquimaris]|uniref:23S rRNA pseudouridine2605 synthase n=1 Tax=Paenimyroides marinum TaxID=1159016 RepID=A0A1H6M4G5_9FLAO|nr:pseudouridine synthase [Paenimyroides aquimaris]SEH93767.1 23S rRNA pseudouridine2605 synthase [Paenimyroides aquimaris]
MNTRGGNNGNRNNRKPSFSKGGSYDKNKQDGKSSASKYNKPFKKDDKPFKKWDKPAKTEKPAAVKDDTIRLNKYISNSGVCSRRDADLYIQSGNVTVNGEVVTEMGYKVKPNDRVVFDGVLLNPEKKVYVLLNKPKGFSTADDENVSSAYDLIRNASTSVLKPVGRMDKSTIGLLLFTNDNEMIQKFTNAAQHSSKLYQVSLDKNLKYEDLEKIQTGVYINEHKVWVEEVSYVENQPKSEVGIKVKTSNVKVVRAVFEKLGYNVIKLDRVMFAGLTKWGIARGQWRFLTEQEVINLKNLK